MSEPEQESTASEEEPPFEGRPPSRAVVIAAGALALLICAFWLSCQEASQPERPPGQVQPR